MDCGQPPVLATERNMGRNRALEKRNQPPTGVASCAVQCPLGICIQGYASHIAAGEYAMALELIMRRNPLPDSVCRVCHSPCETACSRANIDGPVAVNALKRFVMDWAAEEPELPYQHEPEAAHGHKIAIVGAGPAGLSAARDLLLRGFSVTLFDQADSLGGMLRLGIPRFRLPAQALDRDIARILDSGADFVGGRTLGRDLAIETLLNGEYEAVVLAIGAQQPIRLSLETEPGAPETIDALDYLAGQSGLAAGRAVAVVGAGNAGVDVARVAIRAGASRVTVIDQQSQIPALHHEAEAATEEGTLFRMGMRPVRLSAAAGLECVRVEEQGTDNPVSTQKIAADLVIFSVGQAVDKRALDDLDLEWTDGGTLHIDPESGRTSHPRLFAAGDMAPVARTVVEAMASGCRAAWGIDAMIRGKEQANRLTPPPPPGQWSLAQLAPPPLKRIDSTQRALIPTLNPDPRDSSAEIVGALDEPAARAEARRCMLCGSCASCRVCIDTFGCPAFISVGPKVQIDPDQCTGCGDCAILCPNGAIRPIAGGEA